VGSTARTIVNTVVAMILSRNLLELFLRAIRTRYRRRRYIGLVDEAGAGRSSQLSVEAGTRVGCVKIVENTDTGYARQSSSDIHGTYLLVIT
jgi:hypothetical protein